MGERHLGVGGSPPTPSTSRESEREREKTDPGAVNNHEAATVVSNPLPRFQTTRRTPDAGAVRGGFRLCRSSSSRFRASFAETCKSARKTVRPVCARARDARSSRGILSETRMAPRPTMGPLMAPNLVTLICMGHRLGQIRVSPILFYSISSHLVSLLDAIPCSDFCLPFSATPFFNIIFFLFSHY